MCLGVTGSEAWGGLSGDSCREDLTTWAMHAPIGAIGQCGPNMADFTPFFPKGGQKSRFLCEMA